MHCKSLWIKASAKCINVNVNINGVILHPYCVIPMHVCTMSVHSSALEAPVIRTNSSSYSDYSVFEDFLLSSSPSVFGFLLTSSQTSFDSMSDKCL